MKLKYRLLPIGGIDGAMPLNWVFIDRKDIANAALTEYEAVKVIAEEFKDSAAAVDILDTDCVSVSSDGIMNPIAVTAIASVDHGMINNTYGYMPLSPIPEYEGIYEDEPHMRQWHLPQFKGKELHKGPNEKDRGDERLSHNETMTLTGRIANNNCGSEAFDLVNMTEILIFMSAANEIMRDGEVIVKVAGPEVSVGIGMVVSERWGRIFGGTNLGGYKAGMSAHNSGVYAKTVKSDYPAVAAPKEKFMALMLDALDTGLIVGRHLGSSPALLMTAYYYGAPIDLEHISDRAWIELESIGITKELLSKPVKPYTREEMIAHAEEIIPGMKDAKRYKVSEIVEIREAEVKRETIA